MIIEEVDIEVREISFCYKTLTVTVKEMKRSGVVLKFDNIEDYNEFTYDEKLH